MQNRYPDKVHKFKSTGQMGDISDLNFARDDLFLSDYFPEDFRGMDVFGTDFAMRNLIYSDSYSRN